MKKLDKHWLLFLLLILILGSSLSYLALNRQTAESETKETENTQRMAIALVNEDKGASLSGEALAFGDAFVESINNREDHDWFVVSRGVAESGLERNTYDMMIVIPDDFSEKALSIESENPEQVVLNYKINASDNEQIKTEAEKTASNILNDFNRRIIDVYFASIVGNLQNAQDNIGEIISKQAVYTQTFNTEIHTPLENYTNQFGAIKDNTQISKESFTGFQDLVKDFETQLAENTELDENYRSGMQDVFQLAEKNGSQTLDFSQSINQFDESLNQYDVEQQLDNLKQANININNQFAQQDNSQTEEPPVTTFMLSRQSVPQAPTNNIKLGAAALQRHLKESLAKVEATQLEIESRLNPENENGFTGKVKAQLDGILASAFRKDEELNINKLFENPDQKAKDYISEQIAQLPSLVEDDFGGEGLPPQTVTDIKNVIAVTKKYNEEIDYTDPKNNVGDILSHKMRALKDNLYYYGLTMTDTVEIENVESYDEEELATFELNIPDKVQDKYSVDRLVVEDIDFTQDYQEGKEITLEPNEGTFTVNVKLLLKDKNSQIDIFQPIPWSWKLHYRNTKKEQIEATDTAMIEIPETPLVANTSTENPDSSPEATGEQTEQTNEPTSTNADGTADDTDGSGGTDDGGNNDDSGSGDTGGAEPGGDGSDDPPGGDGSDDEGTPPEEPTDEDPPIEEPPVEKVTITNNRVSHKVMTPLEEADSATQNLINAVDSSIKPYQRLFATYETYFGLNMGAPDLRNKLDDKSLAEWAEEAKDRSLYYLFNEKDIKTLLKDYIVGKIVDDVAAEIQQPWDNLHSRITAYQTQVQQAKQNADKLVERINQTAEEAERLNKNLASTLADVEAWRENSLQLLESNKQLQTNQEEEQTAIMALDQEFQPLITASQSLSEQAQGNLNSAETVYDTFDQIDEQADTIQESGTDLVSQAETLSVDMTNKLLADQEFSENFQGVLANSRVGDRQNEELYEFLSNPVQTSNQGTTRSIGSETTENTFTPYYLVLICFIVVLFTAYVISTINQKRREANAFEAEKTLAGLNAPITLVTAGIGVLEGLVIGVVSGYSMGLTDKALLLLTGIIILLITGMLLLATYLLRQLKMIGMFLLLMVLSLYLFGKNAFGSGVAGIDYLKTYSPLHYVESLLLEVWQDTANYQLSLFIIIGIAVLGALANLFVLHRADNEGDMDDESDAEAG
ncbi:type VII secretion protein EsaA [Sediminibacillus halophilus]|uniref:Type VII secretion system accessory factor EsaA n=1 Tax=Sediminibacillus halophilus TaxID=482461 RepID=A0A1G9RTD3_9BACI|nr:type VII secretion protein EsaA [Sediminibacillus halophilus]SDM26237.1 type VII secretion protein EsaA, N-terminal domain-containing protein [Sediminibacillus halophilus]